MEKVFVIILYFIVGITSTLIGISLLPLGLPLVILGVYFILGFICILTDADDSKKMIRNNQCKKN